MVVSSDNQMIKVIFPYIVHDSFKIHGRGEKVVAWLGEQAKKIKPKILLEESNIYFNLTI